MEQHPLLRTKLYIPPIRPELVSRPRLIERLNAGLGQNQGLGRKLTLISAPAGFGKTTLVSEWVHEVGAHKVGAHRDAPQIAWLSLDEGDNDTTRFLSYLIAALRAIEARQEPVGNRQDSVGNRQDPVGTFGKGALNTLNSPQPPPVEVVLTSLINGVTALPDTILLVLDDYHLIDAQPIHDALSFLLEHLPPQMHLVIVTREDPPLPSARLRSRGQLTELRASDLRFSSSEAAEFLNQVMGLDLSAADIAALEARTEGWIAGLQLASLALQGLALEGTVSIQGRKDSTSLVESFTGSHRFVLDYLVEEVLHQQSESVQTFLLQTSVLDRMTGSLCDFLTGHSNSRAILESLDRANLFIVPLDEERRWYRYHHLFADLLRRRRRQDQREQVPRLHTRASEWYEQNGFADEAIEHALHAEDFERAAQLLEEHTDASWGRGEHRKLRRWLDRLPEEMLFSRPHIAICQARYQCLSGQLDAAERTLKAAEQALGSGAEELDPKALDPEELDPEELRPDRAPATEPQQQISPTDSERVKLRGRAAATRALLCSYQGDVPGIVQHARQALEYLPREDLTWRGVTAVILGNAHGFKGDMTAAYEARFQALKACEAAGDTYFIMRANLELAITLRAQGRLQRTIEICQQQRQLANANGQSQTRAVGWLLAIWGETLAELNHLDEALDRAKKGFELTERSGDLQMIGWSFMCLMRILLSRGDLADAEETIQKMENLARESHLPPWIANQVKAWQARLWLAQNKLEPAAQWVQDRGLHTGGEPIPPHEIDFFSIFDYVILARLLIAQGRLDEASKLLPRLLEAAEAGGRISKSIEILVLQALAFQADANTDQATTALERALTLAEPEGFIRTLVDEGPPMAQLLHDAAARGMMPDYTAKLLAAFEDPTNDKGRRTNEKAPSLVLRHSSMVEPLSERELEVLQLIAEGLTNREIASRLFLSLNTVKAHTRNIYGKLGVHNRTQAVVRARALGVLPSNPKLNP
jgi:LuxR family maltose regulon positive regulatory protein